MTKNPWKLVRIDPQQIKDNPYLNPRAPPPPPPPPDPAGSRPLAGSSIDGDYSLMPQTGTYGLGVDALREACKNDPASAHPQFTLPDGSNVYRPLTFRENLEARVKDYETLRHSDGRAKTAEERQALFLEWLDSCTGMAYQAKTTKFKVIPTCSPLITIDKANKDAFLAVPYAAHTSGVELDFSARGVKYNTLLTQSKVQAHPAWRAAVEDDVPLLHTYSAIVFSLLKQKFNRDTGMEFYVCQNPDTDELRALIVISLVNYSNAIGYDVLNVRGSSLRVAHRRRAT